MQAIINNWEHPFFIADLDVLHSFKVRRKKISNDSKAFLKFSLIIHVAKTKEITSVKEVWKCDPKYRKIQ